MPSPSPATWWSLCYRHLYVAGERDLGRGNANVTSENLTPAPSPQERVKILIRFAACQDPLLEERDLGRGNTHATSENLTPSQLATMWSPQERGEVSDKICSMPSPSRHIVVPTGERDLGRGNSKNHLQSDSYLIFKSSIR